MSVSKMLSWAVGLVVLVVVAIVGWKAWDEYGDDLLSLLGLESGKTKTKKKKTDDESTTEKTGSLTSTVTESRTPSRSDAVTEARDGLYGSRSTDTDTDTGVEPVEAARSFGSRSMGRGARTRG